MSGEPPKDAEEKPPEGGTGDGPAVENRWWVDSGSSKETRRSTPSTEGDRPVLGERIFRIGKGFDQDRARSQLTDSNLNLLREANPAEGAWAYMDLIEDKSPPDLVAKVQRMLRLPKWARGVLVDAGTSIRAIATGDPFGERIIELTLGAQSSFDAWAHGEWVREKVFRSRDRALREGPGLIVRYLKSR
jgi:hypothetical protein